VLSVSPSLYLLQHNASGLAFFFALRTCETERMAMLGLFTSGHVLRFALYNGVVHVFMSSVALKR